MTILSPSRRLGAAAAFGAALATVTGGMAGAVPAVDLTQTTFSFSVTGNQTREELVATGLFEPAVIAIPGTVDFAFTIETEGALADGLYVGSEATLWQLVLLATLFGSIDPQGSEQEVIDRALGLYGYGIGDISFSEGSLVTVSPTYSVTAPEGHLFTTLSGAGEGESEISLIGVRNGIVDAIFFLTATDANGTAAYLSLAPEGKDGFDFFRLNSSITGGFVSGLSGDTPFATFGAGAGAVQLTPLAPVPLPAGGVFMLTALGGLGLLARRRKAA